MFQYRKHQGDPFYSPQRDLAFVGPHIVRLAMVSFDPQFLEPWFTKWLTSDVITEAELCVAAAHFAQAFNRILDSKDPVVALNQSGFDKLRPQVQAAIYCRIGQVFLGALWESVKDAYKKGDEPPASTKEVAEHALKLAKRIMNC